MSHDDDNGSTGTVAPGSDDARPEKPARSKVGSRVTIFRPPDSPFWYAGYSVDGRQIRKSLKTTKVKQAKTLAERIDRDLILGLADPADPAGKKAPTIREAITAFLKQHARQGTKEKSIKKYADDLEDFACYAEHRHVTRLDRVDVALLNGYHDQLREHGLKGIVPARKFGTRRCPNKPRTLRAKLKTVRQVMKVSVEAGLLRRDPAKGFKLPKKVKTQAYCWSAQEVAALRGQATEEYRPIFDFFRMTGVRSDEFCWLTKDDLDLTRREIRIRAKVCPQTGKEWSAKHGNERVIPLCPAAFEIARRAYDASPGPWLFYAPRTRGTQPGHYTVQRVWKAVRRARDSAAIARGTTHTFRHVFCSTLANTKPAVPPLQVMTVMGHGSLEIVLMYYHVSPDELRSSINAVNFDVQIMVTTRKEVPPPAGADGTPT